MGNGIDAIKIGVSVVIVLFIATIAFGLLNSGKETANNAEQDINELNVILYESKYTDYENKIITGNQVQSLISKFNGDTVFVRVKTKKTTTWYNYSNENLTTKIETNQNSQLLADMSIKGSANYINPNGKFKCTLFRDENETIMGVIFEQQ